MATLENRYVRIEDWKGNVYYPVTSSGGTTAGEIIDAQGASTTDPSAITYTEGEIVTDVDANGGKAIRIDSSATNKTIFRSYFANAKFGNVSIGMRMKSSTATGDTNIVRVNTYFVDTSGSEKVETALESFDIKASDFKLASTYISLGVVTAYTRKSGAGEAMLKVELIMLPDTGSTVWFDEMGISMEMKSSSGVAVSVDGSVVVFDS